MNKDTPKGRLQAWLDADDATAVHSGQHEKDIQAVLKALDQNQVNPIIGKEINALDHGFIRVIDVMGDDSAIVQSARVSYGKGTKTPSEDESLIRYLMRHQHTTPFEMCEIKLLVKMPIFVARQWVRHRTASMNEYSMRYSESLDEFYFPLIENVKAQSTTNKQGREESLPTSVVGDWLDDVAKNTGRAKRTYKRATASGVARELARIDLPLSTYTEFYWKIDLHNLLHFLGLRADGHAQWEIRQYAEPLLQQVVAKWVPFAYQAFLDYRMNAVTLSAPELGALQRALNFWADGGETALKIQADNTSGMSERERREFVEKLVGVGWPEGDRQ